MSHTQSLCSFEAAEGAEEKQERKDRAVSHRDHRVHREGQEIYLTPASLEAAEERHEERNT